ncbi:MAG TPA: uroporphyrinogen decarboxylase family protein, partial [Thermomicrobiales bacterium]|nr:uroporphyrinogen decarboxylase family protein [Thermomicrobiales bacterium]
RHWQHLREGTLRQLSVIFIDVDFFKLYNDGYGHQSGDLVLAQVAAGAQCVQIFDSWAGALSPDDYRRFVLPATKSIVDSVRSAGAPIILFGTNTAGMLDAIASAGSDVVGADWRIGLDDAWRQIGHDQAIQGNLDPLLLFAPADELRSQVAAVLDRAGGRPGHIFNVGHGILPETPTESVHAVVEMVHEMTAHE